MIGHSSSTGFMEQAGATMFGVVLAGVVGLVAAWLGGQWERNRMRDAWLREQRLELYTQFMEAIRDAIDQAQVAKPQLLDLDQTTAERVLADYHTSQLKAGSFLDAILIVGPPAVFHAGQDCLDALDELFDAGIANLDDGDPAWKQAWDQRKAFAATATEALTL